MAGHAHEKEASRLVKEFEKTYGNGEDIRVYFAPGRVNLIGEHTDYNGGAAMPGALNIGTYFVARKRPDKKLRFLSLNFEDKGVIESSLDDLERKDETDWANYPLGVIWAFRENGHNIPEGLDVLLYGNIPNGAGLSSSASVEVGTGLVLKDMFGLSDVSNDDLARLGQIAENQFCGMQCGIMDQMAIAQGQEGHVLYLTTAPFGYEHVPFDLQDAKVVIASSNKRRGLSDSKYNERRAECEQAVRELQEKLDIETLGELTNEELEANIDLIKSPVRQKRARHAVSENQRTIRAKQVLEEGDLEEFGRLMVESHNSLRDDYEVTGLELDTLVDAALAQPGVIGSRMTGAGFGGCTISIVRNENVDEFVKNVGEQYEKAVGYAADFFPMEIGDGPIRI